MATLSIVIPVYNEEKRIYKVFKAFEKGFNFHGLNLEKVIFVNDGSKDETVLKIKKQKIKLEKVLKAEVQLISYQENHGKGFAVKTGMLASNSDYTLCFDADMSVPLREFEKFLPFIQKGVSVIIGTRKNGESTVVKHQPLYREILGRMFTLLANIVLNTWVSDFTCGFKLFSCEAKEKIFSRLETERWGYDAETLFLAKRFGFQIYEKAVLWNDDKRSRVNLLKDIPCSFLELVKIRSRYFIPELSLAKVRTVFAFDFLKAR